MGQKYKLNDLAYRKLEYGSGAAATEYDGSVRYIRISDIDENGKLNDTVVSPSVYDDKYTLKDGDILFARTGATVGKTYRFKETDGNFIFAGFLIRFSPNTSLVLPDYVYYFTKSPQYRQFVLRNMKVVAQPNINAKQYGDLEFYVHSLKEQGCIVDKLIKIERLIDLRKEQLELLDNLIKSRFVEMFGDQKSNPMKWDKGTIRDIVTEVKYGTSKPAVEGGKYKYLRMNNITFEGELNLSSLKYIDIPENEYEKCVVRKGDVMFNRTNSKELVGKTCVFNQDEEMIIAGYIIRVRTNEKALPEYLSALLNSKYGKETLYGMCKAIVGQANINAQELQDIGILIPPVAFQQTFVAFKEQVDKLKVEVQNSLREAQLLFDSLMQKYFG